MPKEIENKLQILRKAIPAFRQKLKNMDIRVSTPIQKTLLNIYWDTPSFQLQEKGYGLRLRKSGKTWIQTVKKSTKKPVKKGQHVHAEWETPIARKHLYPELLPSPVRRLIQPMLSQLLPIFESRIKREIWWLAPNKKTLIELAIDQGYLLVRKRKIPIGEIELELKKGSISDLHKFTKKLANQFHLVPENKTKAERGYEEYLKELRTKSHNSYRCQKIRYCTFQKSC